MDVRSQAELTPVPWRDPRAPVDVAAAPGGVGGETQPALVCIFPSKCKEIAEVIVEWLDSFNHKWFLWFLSVTGFLHKMSQNTDHY